MLTSNVPICGLCIKIDWAQPGIVYSGLFNSLQVLQRTALGPEPHEAGPVRLCVWMDDCVTCHYNFYYNYH